MTPELEQALLLKYPKIFRQKDLGMNESCMYWGIAIGDGWYKLIDELCAWLQFNTDRNSYPQVEAAQVKEKFGGLRFYVDIIPGSSDSPRSEKTKLKIANIRGAISLVESMSISTCEHCGSPGIPRNGNWMSTLCDLCYQQKMTQEHVNSVLYRWRKRFDNVVSRLSKILCRKSPK